MTLQKKLESLYMPFKDVDCPVYHYHRATADDKFLVWSETGEDDSFNSDNHKTEQQLTGLVDFYTKEEFDPIVDTVQEILDGEGVGWRLSSVQYEVETEFIHYQWGWWIG